MIGLKKGKHALALAHKERFKILFDSKTEARNQQKVVEFQHLSFSPDFTTLLNCSMSQLFVIRNIKNFTRIFPEQELSSHLCEATKYFKTFWKLQPTE